MNSFAKKSVLWFFASGMLIVSGSWGANERNVMTPPPPPPPPPPPEQHSLLFGKVEAYGTSDRRCRPPTAQGSLSMLIISRTGDFAMCCVNQFPPVELNAGDEVFAEIVLEQEEESFDVKIETRDRQFYLHTQSLDAGPSLVSLPITKERLSGDESLNIIKFCIAAKEIGALQTVRVERAFVRKFPGNSHGGR